MQRRLAALGYPVGKVDGKFGENTLYALILFQFAIGYTERTWASESCLTLLYSSAAPAYDPYLPMVKGQSGTPVLTMQQALAVLGYDPGKLDGKYGVNTVNALLRFQRDMGLPENGSGATAECLLCLYSYATPTDLNG